MVDCIVVVFNFSNMGVYILFTVLSATSLCWHTEVRRYERLNSCTKVNCVCICWQRFGGPVSKFPRYYVHTGAVGIWMNLITTIIITICYSCEKIQSTSIYLSVEINHHSYKRMRMQMYECYRTACCFSSKSNSHCNSSC